MTSVSMHEFMRNYVTFLPVSIDWHLYEAYYSKY